MTFVGQNLGAGKWERVKRVVTICVSLVTCVGIMEAIAARLWAPEMIGLFNSNPDLIAYGVERLLWLTAPYFVFGIADVLVGSIRGFGISVAPMVVNLFATCVFRLGWIAYLGAPNCPVSLVYLSWPISWVILLTVLSSYWFYLYHKMGRLQRRKGDVTMTVA